MLCTVQANFCLTLVTDGCLAQYRFGKEKKSYMPAVTIPFAVWPQLDFQTTLAIAVRKDSRK